MVVAAGWEVQAWMMVCGALVLLDAFWSVGKGLFLRLPTQLLDGTYQHQCNKRRVGCNKHNLK